jgi:hypothetical protein
MTDTAIQTLTILATPTEGEVRALALMADYAAKSNFLTSTAPRNDHNQRQADAFFVIMYGREMGVPPMTALKSIYVIDGKPSASVQMLVGIAKRRGAEFEFPDPATVTDKATIKIRRPGGTWKEYTFTMEMANRMGLGNKGNWTKQPKFMLIWRAAGIACRLEIPDLIGGLYPIEELAPDTPVDESGDVIGTQIITQPQLPASTTTTESPVQLQPEPPVNWWESEGALAGLTQRCFDNKFIEHNGDKGVQEALTLIYPKSWADFATRADAAVAIRDAAEVLKAELEHKAKQKPNFNITTTPEMIERANIGKPKTDDLDAWFGAAQAQGEAEAQISAEEATAAAADLEDIGEDDGKVGLPVGADNIPF